MRNENLRRRTDERDIGFAHIASDAWPYMRFKGFEAGVKVVAFVVIEDFPVIVIFRPIESTVHWYGFYKGQWYTDFITLNTTPEKLEDDLQSAADILLDQAADMLENDLKEPEGATVEEGKEPSQKEK